MTKHTPGPWHSDCGCIYAACQMDEKGRTSQRPLAEVTSDQDHDDHYVENCRLIAAAPELLATLIEARSALQFANDSPNGGINDTIWMMDRPETLFDFLDAAIAKATGGEV